MTDQANFGRSDFRPDQAGLSPALLMVLLVLTLTTLGLGLVFAGQAGQVSPIWSVAMICGAGGLLVALVPNLVALSRRQAVLRQMAAAFHNDLDAVMISNPQGVLRCGNPAAQAMLPMDSCRRVDQALAQRLPNAAAIVARNLTEILKDRPETEARREVLRLSQGALRLSVHRAGYWVIWRVEMIQHADAMGSGHGFGKGLGLPALLVSDQDEVLSINDAGLARLMPRNGQKITTLADVIEDLPMRAGQTHRVSTLRGVVEMRAAAAPRVDGTREIYLLGPDHLPLNSAGLANVFDALPAALLHVAGDGHVLVANRAAQRLLAVDTGMDLGPLGNLVEGLGRPVRDWVADVLSERVPNRPEMVRVRNRDDDCFVQITLGRVMAENAPAGLGADTLLAVLHDATELKQLEVQFVQSQKMQAIGALAGGVAHDFNNVLTAISGHTDLLLLRHDQGDPDFADIEQIRQNTNRATALVGQLLAFSRKQSLAPEIVDLRDCLSDLGHLLNRLVGETVRLHISHDPDLMPIRADRRQFEQVVMNLVVNARDAMPDGGAVRVSTKMVELHSPLMRDRALVPEGRYVTLEVRDEGTGIAPDKRDKIFEPFYTTKEVGKGTGLGLSMVYGIVKQTGGYIFVDSELGEGTVFTIYCPAYDAKSEKVLPNPALPSAKDDAPAPPVMPPDAPPVIQSVTSPVTYPAGGATKAAKGPKKGQGETILLVEDEPPVRAFAARALRLRGYHVEEAESAEMALEKLRDPSLRFDLFLSDVVMPGRDGPSWVREALKMRPGTRVVFMSGYAEDVYQKTLGEIPGSVFLQKPFALAELLEKVDSQIKASA